MSIEETQGKSNSPEDKDILEEDFDITPVGNSPFSIKKYLFTALMFLLVASASFGIGRISYLEENKVPVTFTSTDGSSLLESDIKPLPTSIESKSEVKGVATGTAGDSQVVASKNGTKYHLLTCSGAKQISAANKIFFASVHEAQKAGYSPAANCKGLK